MSKIKTVTVQMDDCVKTVSKAFDYEFEGESFFEIPELPKLPDGYKIGLIVGSSGSGKTSMLEEHFGYKNHPPAWDSEKAIVSHFESPEEAINKLGAVGLNSVPSWVRPFPALSTGEKFRANLARSLKNHAVIDEFTSVVDRNVAKSTCVSIRRYVDKTNIEGIVLASCHRDIVEWLQPDWVFDIDTKELLTRGSLRPRPEVRIDLYLAKLDLWRLFSHHHYLSANLNRSAHCYAALWEDILVGFTAILAQPCGTLKNAWRGHRTVVLPDFQGLGIGTKISDALGEIYTKSGKRYFSRTAHYRFGEYRQKSPLWKPTSKNRLLRKDAKKKLMEGKIYNNWEEDFKRVCYSHEYIGDNDSVILHKSFEEIEEMRKTKGKKNLLF